jgi:hypothetical protein
MKDTRRSQRQVMREFQAHVLDLAAGGVDAPQAAVATRPLTKMLDSRAVVLVEGMSDRCALQALAERRGRNLDREGISVVPMGGASNIGMFLDVFGPHGLGVGLAGLCDAGTEPEVRRALEQAGLGSHLTRVGMESLGFYVCDPDLEDELIRAVGARRVERLLEVEGDLKTFRALQNQPAYREKTIDEQLRRFVCTRGRKSRYPRLLVDALDLARVPRPLDRVLADVRPSRRSEGHGY